MFDWFHHTESLSAFTLSGLAVGNRHPDFSRRTATYAGFYMGDDEEAPNYDKDLKLVRSIISGSKGPMLRKATGLDWAGDPLTFADGEQIKVARVLLQHENTLLIASCAPRNTLRCKRACCRAQWISSYARRRVLLANDCTFRRIQ
eukprot:SAG31_NODE_10665_length_1111_cov_1.168806_1_plen_146_part_00